MLKLMNNKLSLIISILLIYIFISCSSKSIDAMDEESKQEINDEVKEAGSFSYYSEKRLQDVKQLIAQNNSYYKSAYQTLIIEADKDLNFKANPVTNKSIMPPSGDKHDYLSIAPYWWPNPDSPDGMPWSSKDGQVNPQTRGDDTDQVRLSQMFGALENLGFAYYFSNDAKYANKAKELIKIWFIDSDTKVNPNVNYGQGVPGSVVGRSAGIIEWTGISNLVTTMQILNKTGIVDSNYKSQVDTWLTAYLKWLQESDLGKNDDNGTQNHANWYDYQVVGLLMYLDRDVEAKAHVEKAKQKRISIQIEPDGSQPKELARTKSVYYSEMNLRAMSLVADMGTRLGSDLWAFETTDGRSLKKAYGYLRPFAEGKQIWTYQQITTGGAEKAIEDRLKPLFSIGGALFNEKLIDDNANVAQTLDYLQKLQFPPL